MRDNMSFVLEGKFKDSFSKAIDTALSHVSDQVTESERELFNSLAGNFRKYQGTVERAEKEIRNLLNQTELSENDKIDLLGYFYKLDVDEEKGLLNDAQKELTAEVRKLFEIGDLKPNQMFRVMQVELQNVLDDMKKDFAKGIEETDEFKNAVKSLQDAVNDFYNKNKNKDDEFFNFNNEEVVEFYKNYTKLISLGQKFKFDEDIVPDLYDEDKDRDITSLLDGLKEADKYIDIADNELDSFIEKQQRLRALNIIKEIDPSYFQNIGDNFELEEARKEIERIQSELNLANERLSSAETEVADTKDEVKKLKEELELASKEALNLNDALTNEINYSDYKHDEVIKLRDELKKLKEENARLKSESSEIISSSADNISNVTSEGLGITQNDVNILESIRQELEDIRKALGSVDDDNGFKNIIQSLKETLSLINEINPKVGKGVYNVSLNAGSDNTNIKKAEAQVQKNWIGKYSKYLRSYEKMLKDFDSIGVSEEQLLANIVGKTAPNQYEEVFNRLSLNNIKGLDTAENKVYALVELFQRITTVIDESTNATDQFSETLRNTFEKNKLGTNIKRIYGEATKPIQQAENTSSDEVNDLLEETIKSEQKAEEWKTTLLEIREVLNGISDVLHEISNGNHLIESFKGLNDILDNTLKNLNETVEKISHSKVTLDEDSLKGTDISSETDGFSVLENKIKNGVVGAINLKNEALKEEKEIVQNVVNDEKKSFSELERELNVGVVSAINNKNNAFKEEVKIVTSTVNQELKKINELKDTLNQPVNDISNKSNISLSTESAIEEQNKFQEELKETVENTHLLTDELGNIKTFYRGLRDSIGQGLTSGRYNGATFWTDNFDLAKEYAQWEKVEKANISMFRPLEIEGNGAYWNNIEYLGTGLDNASQKIINAKTQMENAIHGWKKDAIKLGYQLQDTTEQITVDEFERYVSDMQLDESVLQSIKNDALNALEQVKSAWEEYKKISDDVSNVYGRHTTNEFVESAQNSGLYDGIIFKNIIDSYTGRVEDLSNVIVQFNDENTKFLETISVKDNLNERDITSILKKYNTSIIYGDNETQTKLEKILPLLSEYQDRLNKIGKDFNYDSENIKTNYIQPLIDNFENELRELYKLIETEGKTDEVKEKFVKYFQENFSKVNSGYSMFEKFIAEDFNIDEYIKDNLDFLSKSFKITDVGISQAYQDYLETELNSLAKQIIGQLNETPVSLGAESSIDKQNELQEELKNTTEILENLSNTNNENKTSESVNKEIQAFDNLNNHINGVKDVITEKNKAIVAEGKLVKETVSKENSDFDSLRKNIDKVNESIEENNKSKNKSNKKTDKTNNKNSEEKITEAGKERLDAYTNILRTEKELAKLRLNEEDHSNEIADLEKKKELYRQIWEEKKKITLSSDDELDKIVKEEEELLRATQNSISSMEAKNADSMGKDFKKQIENMQGALNILSQKNFTDDFKTKIDDLSKRLDEFYQQLKNINPENVDELYDSFKNLELEFDELNKIQKNLAQFKLADQLQLDKLEKQISSFTNKNSAMGRKFKEQFDEISAGIKKAYGDANIEQVKEFQRQILQLQSAVENANKTGDSFGRGLVKRIKSISQSAIAMYFSLWDIIRYVRELASTVTEVDTALTELRKVSDASTERLSQSFEKSAETAKELGATITDVINATSDWSRMGYDISDAEELARVATLFQNVGDNMTADSANSYLISTLKGFQMSADQAEEIVDKYNEVANHFAIDTAGIGEALQRSAASFNAANTDLSKSIALITTANSVVQNPETVGTTFKTLSARIRGAKTELQDLGEEEDEFTQTTSKLRDLVQSLTGFDIMEEDGETFKDIYEIILGIGKEWENLSGIEQASLGEALAGKRNNNTFFAIMNNLDDLEKAYQTAENSAGKIYYLYVQKCA